MDMEELENNNSQFEQLTAAQIWQKLYGKEMNCKKHVLEYIDTVRMLKKDKLSANQLGDTYNYIYEHIEGLKGSIKPNTMMFLKNKLRSQLGKYVKKKDPMPMNYFIEFFKKAYPANYRRRDYTIVLMDITKITEEQLWTTLTYINRECLKNDLKLNADQNKHIVDVIIMAVSKNNIKFINKMRSLKTLMDELNICIVKVGEEYEVRYK